MGQQNQFFITTIIAIYGALLATILGVLEFVRHKPRIKVSVGTRILFTEKLGSSEPVVFFQAINTGFGEQVIVAVGLLLHKGKTVTILDFYGLKLPCMLKESRSCEFYLPYSFFRDFRDSYDIKKVFFLDETGRQWKGVIPRKLQKSWKNPKLDGWKLSDHIKPTSGL